MLRILRTEQSDEGTFGYLFIDNETFCVTGERPASGDHPCIPPGTYSWRKFNSPHNGPCLLLTNVPDRYMIEIHSANFMLQLKGCIAPGHDFARFSGTWDGKPYNLKGVTSSKAAMAALLNAVPDSGEIIIEEEY